MISLSPIPTAHPSLFQQAPVRSSTKSYLRFNLAMGRSRGFGSIPCNSDALFRLGFPSAAVLVHLNLAAENNSRTHYAKGTPSPLRAPTACRHTVSGSVSLPSPGFFSPFPHGTGSLSVIREYLALEDGPPGFPQDFTSPVVLGYELDATNDFAYRAVTFCSRPSQAFQLSSLLPRCSPRNPACG